ncbi:signal peptidase I [Zavarzinia sp. CC-PAN008]|uniref:signal peptidase I n=1 Tax=Zavarzinia sp. CC-PAN008 TaxID=3243332 RepID=UPI003F744BBE
MAWGRRLSAVLAAVALASVATRAKAVDALATAPMAGGLSVGTGLLVPGPWLQVQAQWEGFRIPGLSMVPTLRQGDYILARRRDYDAQPPGRGDIVVFDAQGAAYVRRIVALGGDRIAMRHGQVVLNGTPLVRRQRGDEQGVPLILEELADGRTIRLLGSDGDGPLDTMAEMTVPPGTVFVLGDNRANSADSRTQDIGFVPITALRHEPVLVFWSADPLRLWRRLYDAGQD